MSSINFIYKNKENTMPHKIVITTLPHLNLLDTLLLGFITRFKMLLQLYCL